MNNDPNFEQEYKRICTPMPNKPRPVVRFFVDDQEVVERCYFNSADVIRRQGGEFTPSAKEDWTKVGERFGKLKPPAPKTCKDNKTKDKSSRRAKTNLGLNALFNESDIEDVEVKPVKKKKTSHLKRLLC